VAPDYDYKLISSVQYNLRLWTKGAEKRVLWEIFLSNKEEVTEMW